MPLKFRAVSSIALMTLILSDVAKLSAAECTVENIVLTTQDEVNNFQFTYGGGGTCDTVVGDLTVSGSDIVDLLPLHDIYAVNGTLSIAHNPSLSTVSGLSILTSAGVLEVYDNAALTSLDGLETLFSVGDLIIGPPLPPDDPLANIDGLSGLTSVTGGIGFGNLAIQNLDGLSGVSGEVGRIVIWNVPALTDIDGLLGITSVRGDFIVNYLNTQNADGLANLGSVGGQFLIHTFAGDNIDGLAGIASVGDNLELGGKNLRNCTPLRTLLDDVDDAEPGPGPGMAGIPDVGGDVTLNGAAGCSAIPEIFIDTVSVIASDGIYPDWVTVDWIGNGPETHFRLFSCDDEKFNRCYPITDDLAAGISQYDDTFAPVNGSILYYTLRACIDAYCSGYGRTDAGNRLGYPWSLSATDGEYLDKVRLTWADTIGETYFEVYLCFTTAESSCGVPIKTLPADTLTYDDTLATADGAVYYYRLKACNENGCGAFSPANAGSRFGKPKDVIATDAFFEDRVRVSWSDVIGETWYEVYRCSNEQTSSCGLPIATPAANITAYDDLEADEYGTVHYYRLKACNANGCTEFSAYDDGSRSVPHVIFRDGFEAPSPSCPDGLSVQRNSLTDWETGLDGWTADTYAVARPSTFDTPDWAVVGNLPGGRSGSAAFVPDLDAGDCGADDESGVLTLTSPEIVIPANASNLQISFNHWFHIEYGWDGGNLKISVNGGLFDLVPASAFETGAYSDVLIPAVDDSGIPYNTNPLADQQAFTGPDSPEGSGWLESRINLSGIAAGGDTIQLRLDFGVDGCDGKTGWYVDEIELLYSCSSEQP